MGEFVGDDGFQFLGGLAAAIRLLTGLTYLIVAGVGGVLAVLLATGYRQVRGGTHA